jgi:hypothetical protein
MTTTVQARPICRIADEIRIHWPNPYFGADPYILAMLTFNTMNDYYGLDSARSIVNYFLANAKTWRGDHARRIKAELTGMLK